MSYRELQVHVTSSNPFFDVWQQANVTINSLDTLYDSGMLPLEIMLRLCSIACMHHGYKHGHLTWQLCLLALFSFVDSFGTSVGGWCKGPSLIMRDSCSDFGLHGFFWSFWAYGALMVSFRLGLKWRLSRCLVAGLLTFCVGIPFESVGNAAGWWQSTPGTWMGFGPEMYHNDLGTRPSLDVGTGYWGATYESNYAVHFFMGFSVCLMVELFRFKSPDGGLDAEGYPVLSVWRGVVAVLAGYLALALFTSSLRILTEAAYKVAIVLLIVVSTAVAMVALLLPRAPVQAPDYALLWPMPAYTLFQLVTMLFALFGVGPISLLPWADKKIISIRTDDPDTDCDQCMWFKFPYPPVAHWEQRQLEATGLSAFGFVCTVALYYKACAPGYFKRLDCH